MFDVGFSELVVIAIVALVVIGPERLPKVARTAGHLLGRLQRYVNDVKADINREMQLDELKKLQSELQDSASKFEHSINTEFQTVQQIADQSVASVQDAVTSLGSEAVTPPPASEAPPSAAQPAPTIAAVATPTARDGA